MKHIFKEVAGDKSGPFKIYSEINEDSLKIVVLEHLKAWSTDVKKEQITNLSKLLSVDPEKYFENLKLYLETDSTNVTYEVEGNKFVLYYKTGSNIKIKYFFHGLHPVDYFATVDGLLHEFFKDRALYLNEVTKLQSQNSELVKCKTLLEEKLLELVTRKKQEEEKLYSSFVLVLNEKKRQIQHLNDLLEAFRKGRPTLNPPVSVKKRNKKIVESSKKAKVEIKNEVSSSDDDDANEYDTDEEKLNEVARVCEDNYVQPSTSKEHFEPWNGPESGLLPKVEQKTEVIDSDKEDINFSLLDSEGDDNAPSLPKKKKKVCNDEKPVATLDKQGQINHKILNDDEKHQFPSKIRKNICRTSDKISSFVVDTSMDHEDRIGTHAFSTLSNNSFIKSPGTVCSIKEDPIETSVTYDTQELLDRI